MRPGSKPPSHLRGFTLIELVMVIVILGVVSVMVSVFMRSPIDAYVASGRRAALTDAADNTLRRIGRDVRKALPNSVQTPNTAGAGQCVAFIPTKTGARYLADDTPAGLSFITADTVFNMLGSNDALPPDQRIAVGDRVVVYNLGITDSNAYAGNNVAAVSALGAVAGAPPQTPISIASTLFPLASPGHRFHMVSASEQVVSYVCSGGNLHRTVSNLGAALCAASGPLIARQVSQCAFDYGGTDLQRNALLRMRFNLTEQGETVALQHEIHINNTP
jgi:MSHA biogenesis protein MshO